MRINSLSVKGFRGFNENRTLDFHKKLTLIYGPNSYGKTSISEAFEWLIYGSTSKVESAQSKLEYKGSYRNLHFPQSEEPLVEATLIDQEGVLQIARVLVGDNQSRKYLGEVVRSNEVDYWQFEKEIELVPKPFILQHALKYLLLTTPKERFQGFAQLLGFEELDQIQQQIISLCTAPKLPEDIAIVRDVLPELRSRLGQVEELALILKELGKPNPNLDSVYEIVLDECSKRVKATVEDELLPELLSLRESRVAAVFEGQILLEGYSQEEAEANRTDEEYFISLLGDAFIKKYSDLIQLDLLQGVIERGKFMQLGIELLSKKPGVCPFCGQAVDSSLEGHIKAEHQEVDDRSILATVLQAKRQEVVEAIGSLKLRLAEYQIKNSGKASQLLELSSSLKDLSRIFTSEHSATFDAVENAISELSSRQQRVGKMYQEIEGGLAKVEESISDNKEEAGIIRSLAESLLEYISQIREYSAFIVEAAPKMAEADRLFQYQLERLAGIEDIAMLIELLEKRSQVRMTLEVNAVLSELAELRATIDDFVIDKIAAAISVELTADVNRWYNKIKTKGDPDVHFDAFDLERTKKGKVKARKVQVGAKSYGQDLISAVSSLSESKLNALGLCMSLAVNLKGESPFDFVLIDDPIQSLDEEHATQFSEIIRELVDDIGLQVLILSHNKGWLDQLRAGCRSINGYYYEITAYTKEGPQIAPVSWASWDERLQTVDAILKDSSASSVRLQQAEQEIRIVVCEVSASIYAKVLSVDVSPHKLNSKKVTKILTECGVKPQLVDRIRQTFVTTDDSHHAPKDYSPVRERISRYHSWAHELIEYL